MIDVTHEREQVHVLSRRWADAEQRGDSAALDELLAADFAAVGPRGFVLTRQQWLDRYRSGDLKNEALTLRDASVREYGDSAITIAVQEQRATFQGHDASGRFRLGIVAVRQAGRWVIAGLQLSGPIPETPSARA
jgi:ketosteroid isomerase-like protein